MTHTDIPAPTDPKAVELLRWLGKERAGLTLAEMGRRLQSSRGGLRRLMDRLRDEGYLFAAVANRRWALIQRPDTLAPHEVLPDLATRQLGRPYHAFRRVASTNDVALELARSGAPEGTLVTAETQTRGRGRLGRNWAGTPGKSLALSLVLRPRIPSDEFPLLTLSAAVAVAETLAARGLDPRIKWPNDVLVDGRKVCGILTEMQAEPDRLSFVVLGIGVNLNQALSDFPEGLRSRAASLLTLTGKPERRAAFLQDLLLNLEEAYERVRRREGSRVLAAWRRWADLSGRQVRVTQVGRSFFAQALHVDEKGALWVRNDAGMVERLTAGDVETLRLERAGTRRRVSGRMVRRFAKRGGR